MIRILFVKVVLNFFHEFWDCSAKVWVCEETRTWRTINACGGFVKKFNENAQIQNYLMIFDVFLII